MHQFTSYIWLAWATIGLAHASLADNSLIRDIEQGQLKGVQEGHSIHFRAIPYAQAPVGNMRWQAPAPPTSWQGLRSADRFGYICPQKNQANVSREDCLTLNISAPSQPNTHEKLPVIVWLHGGGFVSGSGASPVFSSEKWNKENVILVTLNYRLGAMGFFAHPALKHPEGSNYGLMDMIAALKWLQTNIGEFGGNPERLTIMGGSAGGMAVQLLMVSPQASGLFSGAITQSGYGTSSIPRTREARPLKNASSAEALSIELAALAAHSKDRELSSEELHNIPAQDFAENYSGAKFPFVDGISLSEESAVLFAQGKQHPIPFIAGATSFDGNFFTPTPRNKHYVFSQVPNKIRRARRLYRDDFDRSEAQGLGRLYGDIRYVHNAFSVTQHMALVSQPGYLYLFDYLPPEQRNSFPGAPHYSEVPMLFSGNSRTANTLRAYWLNFVRSGNPNGEGLAPWPSSEGEKRQWMVFNDEPATQENVLRRKMQFLERSYQDRISPLLQSEK